MGIRGAHGARSWRRWFLRQPIYEGWMSVRATTAFNKIVAPLGVTVTDVVFQGDSVILLIRARRRRLLCSCGWSTSAFYDRSVRRWRHLDASGMKVFLQAEIRRLDLQTLRAGGDRRGGMGPSRRPPHAP